MGTQGENKRGDPFYLLQIFDVLSMTVNIAKFEKIWI